jgi:hypothetical protein
MSDPSGIKLKRYIKIASTAIGGLLLISIVALLAAHGTFLSKNYLEPWSVEYHKKFSDPRLQVISHGLLAPNAHNMQSWRIVLDERDALKFKLYLDEKRLLPATDPFHRQSVISQGTFLELMDIAAKKLGYSADIKIFPEGECGAQPDAGEIRSRPTAAVTLSPSSAVEMSMYKFIFERVTTRTAYLDKALPLIRSVKSSA